jgi:hypothetical protein
MYTYIPLGYLHGGTKERYNNPPGQCEVVSSQP